MKDAKAVVEALLFASPEPLTLKKISEILGIEVAAAKEVLTELMQEYNGDSRGIEIAYLAGGYQLQTRSEYAEYVEKLFPDRCSEGLSNAALETLAIVAYRQPITRAEIEAIRGVRTEKILNTLTERGLLKELGRKDAPGRPILYGTTKQFLQRFGLKDLSDLPPLKDPA